MDLVEKLATPDSTAWRRSATASALVWGAAAVYTVGRSWLAGSILAGDGGFLPSLGAELRALLVWALATPLIVASARRFPLPHRRWRRNAAIHLAASVAFIYLLQLLVGAPYVLSGAWELPTLLRHGVTAFVAYYHLAGLVYGLILGLALLVEARRAAPSAATHAQEPDRAAVPEDGVAAESAAIPEYLDRLAVKTATGIVVVDVGEIDWIQADGDYVRLHTTSRELLLRETLKSLEERLDPARFVRIHRSSVVNVQRVRRLHPQFHGDYDVVLEDGTELRLSRTRRNALAALLDHPL